MNWCRAALVLLVVVAGAGPADAKDNDSGLGHLGEFIPLKSPQPAPDVSFIDADGKSVPLSQFKGKPVLVNLWATWCHPCVEEMPLLDALQKSLGDKLTVLAISEDRGGTKVVQPFVDKLGLANLKIFLDPTGAFGDAFKVEGLPTSILIDDAGNVRGRVLGEAEWDTPKMLSIIEPYFSAKNKPGEPVKASAR